MYFSSSSINLPYLLTATALSVFDDVQVTSTIFRKILTAVFTRRAKTSNSSYNI